MKTKTLVVIFGALVSHVTALQWNQVGGDLLRTPGASLSGFGTKVALSCDGQHLAVGDAAENEVNVFEEGLLRSQLGESIVGDSGDRFGGAISINCEGSRIAIGAPGHSSSSGMVQVFEWDGSLWTQLGEDLVGSSGGDRFGTSVAISNDGSIVAIGAPLASGVGGDDAGEVGVFKFNGTSWEQLGAFISGVEFFDETAGDAVSLNSAGTILAVGSSGYDDELEDFVGINKGLVKIYQWNGVQWLPLGGTIFGDAGFDSFGSSLSLSSDGLQLAVASGGGNYVRVFKLEGNSWNILGDDVVGTVVSLADDGLSLAVGTGEGSSINNMVRVFELAGSSWVQVNNDIKGASNDFLGASVSIRTNDTVAIGTNSIDIGARVYSLGIASPTANPTEAPTRSPEVETPSPTATPIMSTNVPTESPSASSSSPCLPSFWPLCLFWFYMKVMA